MRNLMLALVVVAFYVLHQDVWFWDEARPLLFGVLPIGLTYHVLYSIVAAALMWLLVRCAWPGGDIDELGNTGRPGHHQ